MIKQRTKHREAELRRNARTKEIADYMKQIMPAATISQPPQLIQSCTNLRQNLDAGHRLMLHQLPTHTRLSKEIIYETPKREPVLRYDDDDYDNEFLEEDSKTFGREYVSPVAGPYLIPYVYKRRFLDTQYGKR